MTRAVFFNLFETLGTERGTLQPRASAAGEALGLIASGFRAHWKRHRPAVIRGRETFSQALLDITSGIGPPAPPEAIARVCADRVRAKAALFRRLSPDVLALCESLRARGLRLAVVSNCMAEDVEAWPSCALAPLFDVTAFSFLVGAAKPEPEIYLEALRRLHLEPTEALFVGDGADNELAGARRAGMRTAQAVWFSKGAVDREAPEAVPRLERPGDLIGLVAP
jgi:putative hydrolase of the HAD superfamily